MTTKIALLETIFLKTGIYISNKNDCRAISQLIQKEKIGYLSESTLYRLFLSKTNQHRPYKNTYELLSIFCGFKSWNDFQSFTFRTFEQHEDRFFRESLEAVVSHFVANARYHSLIDLFDGIAHLRYRQQEFIAVTTFSGFLKKDDFPLFIRDFGDHPFVRHFLIEALHDPCHRPKGYTQALHYYLQHKNPIKDSAFQDYVFGHTVLFRHAFLERSSDCTSIGQHLFNLDLESPAFKELHLFPKTRYLGYLTWHLHLTEETTALEEHLYYLRSWTLQTIQATQDYSEVNIVYQTLEEVYQQLQLEEELSHLRQVYHQYLQQQPAEDRSFILHHHANGIFYFFPPCG
ncbi:MAG: hypothetical protein ACK5SQ_13950 [Chitinophagales bacterium]|jgi:hypothetical protein